MTILSNRNEVLILSDFTSKSFQEATRHQLCDVRVIDEQGVLIISRVSMRVCARGCVCLRACVHAHECVVF